jgi:hypothetical protein
VKNLVTLIALSTLIISCGKIKVNTDLPDDFKVGPDFKYAAEFCDERYGKASQQSEECFIDYRTYLSPKVTLDFASINTFCKASYGSPEDIKGCQSDLLSIIKNSTK